jgi:NADH-ubiquinone oxidoreductase chain 5
MRHTIKDSQDIRFVGNLSIQIPFTSVCLSVSSFALCGIPLLAGFYSKILEMVSFSYVNCISFLFFVYIYIRYIYCSLSLCNLTYI